MIKENLFDRNLIKNPPLSQRLNKIDIAKGVIQDPFNINTIDKNKINKIMEISHYITKAKRKKASAMCVFGAHTIKNCLGPLLGDYIQNRWFSHLATNGAGVIHDWEFAYQGQSSEDVRENVQKGWFGTWEETGLYINIALTIGAFEGMGYGESIGAMIHNNGFTVPDRLELQHIIENPNPLWKKAAAADLLNLIIELNLPAGYYMVTHPWAQYSIQARCYESGVPFTSHPMFGHDIIYTHKANNGSVIGRTAERDFLSFASSVSRLEHGVYLSVGSAVMSPMIFEKSLSMARNILLQKGENIRNCHIYVVDLHESTWDWSKGEPPQENPAYYHRFMKTFYRMGCPVEYISMDNRQFFLTLNRLLHDQSENA